MLVAPLPGEFFLVSKSFVDTPGVLSLVGLSLTDPASSIISFSLTNLFHIMPTGAATLSQLESSPPNLSVSPGFHSANNIDNQTTQMTSPSTLAVPPIPMKLSPSLPCSDSGTSTGKQSSSRSKLSRAKAVKAAPIDDIIMEWEDKKQAKRAANRMSAHLSRKRKKLLIEDLKDENVELRRKEQILRSIPDLIVVFDSSGCITFISHSVTRFMNYTAEELEDTSFWDRLTEESVRLIKSAFMDALAVKRHCDEDSTPLANGESMTVTLIPKKENDIEGNAGEDTEQGLLVSLKGVVHFGEEYPECVCSIRPEGMPINKQMDSVIKESCSALTATVTSRNRRGRGHEHHISDIDSEKS
jgi:PAS domain S-box-containing protein